MNKIFTFAQFCYLIDKKLKTYAWNNHKNEMEAKICQNISVLEKERESENERNRETDRK